VKNTHKKTKSYCHCAERSDKAIRGLKAKYLSPFKEKTRARLRLWLLDCFVASLRVMTNFYDLRSEIKKTPAFLGFIFMNFNEVALLSLSQ
jgi:hypothetical protein